MTFTEAKNAYNHAATQAKDAYDAAMAAAGETYVKNLKKALDVALTAKNLDEANQIDAEIKSFKAGHHAVEVSAGIAQRLKLMSMLANTKWDRIYSDEVLTLSDGGSGQLSGGRKVIWAAINGDQILVMLPDGGTDLCTFDQDRKAVVKEWIGQYKKGSFRVDGKRVP
jgi:hypothetical protein